VFGGATLGPIDKSLKDALAQRGLVDGGSIEVIYRYANGASARLAELAGELVAQKPDMLLGIGGDVIKALFDASKGSIPIVGGVSDNPLRAGTAASLDRLGKNFTGVTFLTDEMAAKRVQLLKEAAPNTTRVAAIFNPLHLDDELTFARRGAESLGIDLTSHPINNVADLDAALSAASASGADSLFDLDWCADPTDLERALARRLLELEPSECGSMSVDEKLARLKLAREFERVLQH
jgi:putative ABC transport system substrate-binding protein